MEKRLLTLCLVGMMAVTAIGCGQVKKQIVKDEKKTVVLYVTRHGKTMLNVADRVQGWADSPLTKDGVQVAEYLGKGLKDIPFVAAYSSDSGRAIETANIVLKNSNQKNNKLVQSKNLREWNFGKYEGDLNKNMWGDFLKDLNITFEQFSIKPDMKAMANSIAKIDETKQAENWDQISNRVKNEVDKICEETSKKGGGNVLLVSHGLTIGTLVSAIDSKVIVGKLENASITKIVYKDGKYTIEAINDMSYVEKGKVTK